MPLLAGGSMYVCTHTHTHTFTQMQDEVSSLNWALKNVRSS